MTRDEFNTLTQRLFVSIPGLGTWLQANTPDLQATLEVWQKTLSQCQLDECLLVVSEWIEGQREPPKTFEWGSLALHIRGRVMFERDKDSKRKATEYQAKTYAEHKRQAAARRRNYEPLSVGKRGIAEIYREGCELRKKLVACEITQDEYDSAIDRLVQDA